MQKLIVSIFHHFNKWELSHIAILIFAIGEQLGSLVFCYLAHEIILEIIKKRGT
jgi:hypothetical protein